MQLLLENLVVLMSTVQGSLGGRKKGQRESVTIIKGLKTVLKEKVIECTELGSKYSHSNPNLVTKGS